MRLLLAISLLFSLAAFAETPHLVVDLQTRPMEAASSRPVFRSSRMTAVAFFVAESEQVTSLWRTDGTAAGTFALPLVFDHVARLHATRVMGDVLYLTVDTLGQQRIWKSDGTVAGTVPVTEATIQRQELVSVTGNTLLYMKGWRELWVHDGSGSRRLAELSSDEQVTSYAQAGNVFYIGNANGIWKSDGTEAGTSKVTSVPARMLTAYDNRLYFAGTDAANGAELWTTDGTSGGTRLAVDLTPGAESTFEGDSSAFLAASKGLVFTGSGGTLGVTNGTAAGTRIIGRAMQVATFSTMNGLAFFGVRDATNRFDLWRSDGTEAGTRMLYDLGDSTAAGPLVPGTAHLYFYTVEAGRNRLFRTDGTEAGTRPVLDTPMDPVVYRNATTIGDRVVFVNNDEVHGLEPWISDGTPGGTRMIANVQQEIAGSSSPRHLVAGTDRLWFSALADGHTETVWSTDGTAAGTRPVMADSTSRDGIPVPLAAIGNQLYVTLRKQELWRAGSAPGEEVLVADLGAEITTAMVVNGRLYLHVDANGLWTSDGTTAGTFRLLDDEVLTHVVSLAGEAFVARASDGTVYRLGVTPEQTQVIARTGTQLQSALLVAGGAIYLFSDAGNRVTSRLWRLSGAPGDATVVRDFSGVPDQGAAHHAEAGGELLFALRSTATNVSQHELWKTDGTAAGTIQLRVFPRTSAFEPLTRFVSLGDRIVFGSGDDAAGRGIWVSDGTIEGTELVRRDTSIDGRELVSTEGIAYFPAATEEYGNEPWRTDGTPAGTWLLADLSPGTPMSSEPEELTRAGDTLFFNAYTREHGWELRALPLGDTPAASIDDVHVTESAGQATLTVRLTRASRRRISVRYETIDRSATAGRHYTAASGTLTFEPGETAKTIALTILPVAEVEPRRTFVVRISSDEAAVERTHGAVLIDETDARADLSITLVPHPNGLRLMVTNAGPAPASHVRLCTARVPNDERFVCRPAFVVAPGATETFPIEAAKTILAQVTAAEVDPNPANNSASWLIGDAGVARFVLTPAMPVAGTTATMTLGGSPGATITMTSSDPTVLTVPATVALPSDGSPVTVAMAALGGGTSTVTITYNGLYSSQHVVRILGAGEAPRVMPLVTLQLSSNWQFGKRNTITATVAGVTFGGTTPTGTVVFFDNGVRIGEAPLTGGTATLVLEAPEPAIEHRFSVSYSGDAHFFDAAAQAGNAVYPNRGTPSISARADGETVIVTLRGIRGFAPPGRVSVMAGSTLLAENVTPTVVDDSSSAISIGPIAESTRTLTVHYKGSDDYDVTVVTIPIARGGRTRAVRH